MKKIHMIVALLAMFAPMTQVWAVPDSHSTHYGKIAVEVATGEGTVYVSTSSTATSGQTSGTWDCGGDSSGDSKTWYIYAKPNSEDWEFKGWSTSKTGTPDGNTTSPVSKSVSTTSTQSGSPSTTTYYAHFASTLRDPFDITFAPGNYTVDGVAVGSINADNYKGLRKVKTVALSSSDENFLNWLINNESVANASHTLTCESDTTVEAVFLTADQVTTVTTIADLTSALSNAAYKKIIIPSGTSLTVAKGATVTVPAGKQLVVDGTLNVLGTVSNSGVISGSGKLYKVSQLITQGDVKTLYNVKGEALGNVALRSNTGKPAKYRTTTVTSNTPTVSGTTPGCTVSWGALLNGTTAYAITAQNPKAVKVTLNTTACVNEITAITGTITGDIDTNGDYVLLANCNLTGPTVKEGSNNQYTRLDFHGTIDCAGKKLTSNSYQFRYNFTGLFLNGSIDFGSYSCYMQQPHAAFFNCSSVQLKYCKNKGATFYFYDCGSSGSAATISFSYYSNDRTTDYRNAYYYCGVYSYTFSSGNDTDMSHVYAGSYSSDPTAYLYNVDEVEAVYNQTTKYYDVREKREPTYVCVIGTTQYESLTEAVTAAGNGAKIALTAAIDLSGSTLTIPSSKNITISLDKHTVTGGKIVNNGTLTLVDLTDANQGTLGSDIENNGTIDVTYGTYSGNVLLNSGTFTTHGGVFTGTISAPSGVDLKEVANLRGGQFSKDPAAALRSDISAIHWGNPQYYWVGVYPAPIITSTTYSGTDKAWKMDFLSSADLALYQKQTDRSEFSSDADWRRRAELESSIHPYDNYPFDCALIFDRDVSSGAVTFAGKTQMGVSESLDKDVSANTYYPVLAKRIAAEGYTPYTFKRTILEVKSATAGVKNNSTANNGVVCAVEAQLCTQSKNVPGEFDKLYALAQVRYMLGGKKAAIDRGTSRLAYDSLAEAVAAVQNGETVLVGADTDANVTLSKVGTFTIDPYGFNWTGNAVAGDGFFFKSQAEVDSLAVAQGVTSAQAVTYVVAQKVALVGEQFFESLTEAVANANGAVVTLLAATDETITLTAEGQTFTLNKNGIAFDDAKVVTTIENGSVTVASGESGTVYTAVTSIVDASDGHKYNSVTAAIAGVPGNDISVTITANDTETVTLPQGKTLTVTTAAGVTADLTVTPGDGAFIVESAVEGGTKYESKKITVTMAEPQATVEVKKIDHGTESAVTDSAEINAAVTQLMGNHDVPRTDNTDKLDVLDKITVTPTKIVEEVVGGNTIIRSATFDVVPTLNAGQSLAEGQKLKFRLPVDAAATQLAAIVYHNGAQFGIYPVQTYNDEKYVEVESDTFSPYGYELLDGETANPIAAIGTTGYATLAAAVAAASSGDTITMLADDTVSLTDGSRLTIDKSLTITGPVDTNGEPLYTIYGKSDATGTNNIYIDGAGTVTLSNLKIEGFGNNKGTDSGHAPVYVASSFTGTVNLDTLYISDFNRGGVFLYGGEFNVTDCYIDCANSRSGAFTKGIEIKGSATGTIKDTLICNMERSGSDAPAGIEIYGKGSVLVDSCTIISDEGDHASVKATYGIVSSRVGEHDPSGGSLHVTDCYIDVSNGALSVADSDEYGPVNNYSIVVDGEDTYFSNYIATWSATSSITINEGEFSEDVYADAGTITITDGTFNNFAPYAGTDGTIAISGGIFDHEVPEEHCAEGYIPATYDAASGLYTVKQGEYVAAVYDDSFELVGKYETLYDAVRAAQDGYTVELLADVEESVMINKSIALTTGDYTITGVTKVDAGATVTMEDVTLDGNGMIYALDIAGGATVEVADVTIGGGQWCNVHLNGGALTGSGVTMLGDDVVVAADGQSCTYRDETVTEAPWGMDLSKMAGKTLKFPFMDIVRESGTDVVELDDTQDKPLVQAGSILYVANMPGDTTLTGVTLPARFGSYSLTIDAGIAFLGDADTPTTGWTIGDWNEVIDTGSTVLDAIGEDSDDVPVELTLNGDADLGDNVFEFRYQNLTIDGANHAVSGTIKYTDDAGVVENIVLGTEEKPLTLDMTEVTETIHLGNGVDVANVVVQLTTEQATAGTPVFTWTAGDGTTAPAHEEIVIQVAGSASDSALVWDNELGVAYIGPCEARLTGPTHEEPVYTSLAHAIELAANSGDTVTLLMDVENFTGTQIIGKSLTLDGADHKIIADAGASGEEMFDVAGDVDVTIKNVTVDGVHKYTYCIQAFGDADLTLEDVTVLHGTKVWFGDFKYGAGVHVNGANLLFKGNFTAFSGGKTDASFPFTGILYEGGAVLFADGATASIANPEDATDTDLLLVGMLGALDVSDPDDRAQVEDMLATMNVPAGFYPYTLKINPDEWNDSFEQNTSFTGASPLGWNDIIDYGKAIMDAISMDTAETPVEVGLLTDTILPDTFTFEDSNFTVNGNDYALSGTIAYTDNAGLIENLVMGTDGNALVLDMTGVTQPIEIGSGIVVENVTIKLTEAQATAGTPIIIWDTEQVDAPENEAGVTVHLVDGQGADTGETAELIWDDEMGLAYIGPVEARLTGPTHDKPIYTSLAQAIELAAQSGDTVTLMMDITGFSGTQDIAKSLTLDGAGHKIVAAADASGEEMFDVAGDVDVTITGLTLDGAHKYTYCVQAYGSDANLTLNNVTILHGTKEWFSGFKYGAGVHVNGANLTVSGSFTAFSGGKTDESFPFTGILYEGGTIRFANGATASIANPEDATDTDLLLVGMLGALDVSDPADKAEVEAMLAGMNIPAGYYPYTLKINPDEWNSGFEQNTSFTGASPLGWNSIIDYGKAIMTAVSMDTAETPVEVGLLTDTVLPDTFTYEDANFSVNGNGNALSGTIVFKDEADGGLLHDIALGADGKPLVIDLTHTTNAVDLGAGVTIAEITVKMTAEQAHAGTVVFDWNTQEVTGDDLPQHGAVSVTVVNDQGGATGDTKSLIWDEEYGIAYIGPVEARLTGATHETPIYTTLADALARALDGDTVKLLSNATLAQPQGIGVSATLDLAGLTVDVTGAAGILVTNATLSITNTVTNATDAITGTIKAGTEASPASLVKSGEGGVVRIPTGIFAAAEGQKVLEVADNGKFEVSGGYFSVAVLPAYCAAGYAPADAPAGSPQPYTVAEAVEPFVYPIEGTAGVPITNKVWLATQFPSIYPDAAKPIYASITNDLVTALSENGANGLPKWQDYVLGLDPSDPNAQLRLTAAPVSADGTQVAISTVIDKTKFPVLTNVTVTFRLAEQNGAEWTDVDGCTGSAEPSFTRPLDGVVDKVLRIFADIEVR